MRQIDTNNEQAPAISLVQAFRQLRVLVIGDVMLDTYLEGEASHLCSEGPVPVVRKTIEQRIPGGAANTAANLRALEAEVTLLGVVGRDSAGSLLRDALRERTISERWLVEDESASTLHKLRILANGQYVVRFDEGGTQGSASSPYTVETQQRLLAQLAALYPACDVVVVSDYCYGVLTDELIECLYKLHEKQPKVVLIDSKALLRFQHFPATLVTPNYREAQLLLKELGEPGIIKESVELKVVEQMARRLLAHSQAGCIAITLAEQGVFLLDRQQNALHLPAHPIAHANDVGAGDSFTSAVALALAAGGEIKEAAQIGLDAAQVAVSRPRTAVVHYHELLQKVSLRAYTSNTQQSIPGEQQASLISLLAQLDRERQNGHTIVFTNGVFDILHAGHVHFLRQARALGDILVVGINSDSSTHSLKGSGRPINGERDRIALVAALDMVDYVILFYVILFNEETPTELIRAIRPTLHVKGGDYADEDLPESEAVREAGGRVVILPLAGSMSTSRVIERIVTLASEQTLSEASTYRERQGEEHAKEGKL